MGVKSFSSTCVFSSAAQFWVILLLAVPHLAFIAMEGGSMYVSRGTSGASGLEWGF